MPHEIARPNWLTIHRAGACLPSRAPLATVALASISLIASACASSSAAPPRTARESIPLPTRCATLPATPDTITRTVYGVLEAPLRRDSLPKLYTDLVLDAIRQGVVVPRPLALTVMSPADTGVDMTPGVSPNSQERLTPAAFGEIEVTLGQAGDVHNVHLTQSSQSPALDAAFAAAPTRADSLRLFPSLDPQSGPAPVHLFIAMQSDRPRTGRWAPLFTIRVPVWRYAHAAFPVAAAKVVVQPGVAYPNRLVDSVAMTFVVNESGRAVPGTLRLVHARFREFAQAAAQSVRSERYYPAVIAGCAASSLLTTTTVYQVGQ